MSGSKKLSRHTIRHGCLYRKSDSAIMVMKAAEDGRRYDAAHVLDRAIDRSVLVERPMSPQLIIISGIISGILRQYPAQVRFAQNNHMVDALASDRTDQPFGEAVLPRRARGDRLNEVGAPMVKVNYKLKHLARTLADWAADKPVTIF